MLAILLFGLWSKDASRYLDDFDVFVVGDYDSCIWSEGTAQASKAGC